MVRNTNYLYMKKIMSAHPRVAPVLVGAVAALSLFVVVPAARASSLTSAQVSAIVTMLQAFGANSATIANVQAALTGTPVPSQPFSTSTSTPAYNGPGNASSCMSLSGTLSYGSEGEDVTKLQQFLAKDKSVYPQGLVTGFYGHATEDAVQRYQAAHGIVASGTPNTTGYGLVGPHTRGELEREMESECNSGDSHSNNATSTSSEGEHGSTSAATSSDSSSSSSDN
jgi:peptidoglycan hydrolase-like protein with peptidoglycan-binding domain